MPRPARYGQHAATVVKNHRAKLALSGITDASTTRDVAQVIGDTDIVRESITVDADGRTSASRGIHTQQLASAAHLRQLEPFEGVLVYGHLAPIALRLRKPAATPRSREKSDHVTGARRLTASLHNPFLGPRCPQATRQGKHGW